MNFHFVIYSSLSASGGGRETWINQFLPSFSILCNCKIFVYYFFQGDDTILLDAVKKNLQNVYFVPISCKFKNTKYWNILRFIKYVAVVATLLLRKTNNQSIVVAVGSFYDAFPIFLAKIISFGFFRFHTVIWLRSILKYQLRALRIKKYAALVLKIERFFLKKSSLVIANGWDTQKYYKTVGIDSVVIPNAIDLNKFYEQEINRSKPIIISYIGRLSQEKGLIQFIEATQKYKEKNPTSKLIFEVVGDGPLLGNVLLKVRDTLIYKGRISNYDMIDYLKKIHCGVALTYNDNENGGGGGLSNGLLELMAARKLIIAWDIFTFTQILSKDSALLVNEGDVDGLVHSFEKIENNYSQYFEMIENNYKKVQDLSIEKHVDKFLSSVLCL